jgi:low temperature requirement protein LtrA
VTARPDSWLELFFDLCFVVAVGAVAEMLQERPTAQGAAIFAALFVVIWWAWGVHTWYAFNIPERSAVSRVGALAVMLTVLAMASQVGRASHGDPRGLLLAFVVFHAIMVILFVRVAAAYPARRAFAFRYVIGFGLASAAWLISLALPAPARPWVWAVALAIDLITPWFAALRVPEQPFHPRSMPERHGLFTIIVLGEAIIAVGRGTADAPWTPAAMAAAVAGFAIAVVIWWAYFARAQAALLMRGRRMGFIWAYGHIFVWAGIAMTGVGISLAIAAGVSGDAFAAGERLVLCGGLALYLAAMALLRATDAGRLTDPVAIVRLATAAVILAVGLVGGGLSPATLTVVVAVIAVAAGIVTRFAWGAVGTDPA